MIKFDLFRTRMKNESVCRTNYEQSFITEGAAPITIHILRLDKDRDATMVFTDAEGPDAAIVFTPKQQTASANLLKTDYYTWDDKMFFVYEDVLIAREVAYIKQRAYQCNAKVQVLDSKEECGGYFISSLRSYTDTEFQQKINISDKEQPVLVVPAAEWVAVGTKLMIGGKPWKIIDFDSITNPGIAYVSLERDFFQKGNDVVQTQDDEVTLHAGMQHIFATQDGYFNSSSPLNIKSRTATQVIFTIPYGIETVSIGVKDAQGVINTTTYKVVV